MVKFQVKMVQKKVTPGAVCYQEVNDAGEPIKEADGAKIGQQYIRKSALGGKTPANITVTVEEV